MENETVQAAEEQQPERRMFSQADVDHIVAERLERDRRIRGVSDAQKFTQQDVDRIVSERLERDRRRAAAQREPGDEPGETDLMQRIQELERQSKEYEMQATRAKAREILAARKLPCALENMLDYSSAEACHASIDAIDSIFKEAVQEGINARLRVPGVSLPRGQSGPDYDRMTDSEYYTAKYGKNWNDNRR